MSERGDKERSSLQKRSARWFTQAKADARDAAPTSPGPEERGWKDASRAQVNPNSSRASGCRAAATSSLPAPSFYGKYCGAHSSRGQPSEVLGGWWQKLCHARVRLAARAPVPLSSLAEVTPKLKDQLLNELLVKRRFLGTRIAPPEEERT